jgi:two-component system chemotaxis response regulator CheB
MVVASASNGAMALQLLKNETVDVVLLDIEMPEMDGLTALPKILELKPSVKIIMVSTLSQRGAEISLQALALGAADYVPKPSSRGDANANDAFYKELREKVTALGLSNSGAKPIVVAPPKPSVPKVDPIAQKAVIAPTPIPPSLVKQDTLVRSNYALPRHTVKAIAIGSSTGGPQALMQIFAAVKNSLSDIPVFITQHMPPTFTTILAEHIAKSGGKICTEANQGDVVKAGCIYIAPGDYHMVPQAQGGQVVLSLNQNPPVNYCRPSVDPMLDALATIYGKNLLTLILTGMGHDGMEGCKKVIATGGTVVAQDEASCVVYGMPKAVVESKLAGAVISLADIPTYLLSAAEVRG